MIHSRGFGANWQRQISLWCSSLMSVHTTFIMIILSYHNIIKDYKYYLERIPRDCDIN